MKIQLVNTFLVFYLLLPFSRFLDPLPLVLPFVLVHRFCGFEGLAFSRIRFTHRNISRNRCLRNRCLRNDVCNRCLRSVGPCYLDFNSFMIGRLLSICNFYDHCKPQRSLSSLTYCPIFVRLGALVFDFYDRLWIVEYRYSWSPVMSCWPSVTKYNAVLAETLLARLVFLSPLAPFKRDISLSLSVKICRECIKQSKLPI